MSFQTGPGRSVPENITQAITERSASEIDQQTRQDMQGQPSQQAVEQEITYRQNLEQAAIRSLSEQELAVAWKFKMSAVEYAKGKNK